MTRADRVLLLVLAPVLAAAPRAEGEAVPAAPTAVADAVAADRELQRKVEAGLDRCIGAGLSWGHFEGQFQPVLALGPGVPRVLLRLFTTPHAIYAFAHDFADHIACLFAQRGRVTDALRNLRRAVDFGYLDVEWLGRDRDLDPIREDPGFAALLVDLQARLKSLREAAEKELERERGAEPKPPKGE